jgi:cyanate permease
MEFSSLQFLLRPDYGSYEPKLVAKKNVFFKRSVVSDCRVIIGMNTILYSVCQRWDLALNQRHWLVRDTAGCWFLACCLQNISCIPSIKQSTYHEHSCAEKQLQRARPQSQRLVKLYSLLASKMTWQHELFTKFASADFTAVQPFLPQYIPHTSVSQNFLVMAHCFTQ